MNTYNQGYHILFVDDDRVFGKLYLKWFGQNTNYAVAHTYNADEALVYLEDNHVDLVVTNIRMPGMDGIELTRVINERFKSKVIIFTGGDFPGERQQAFASGVAARLFKPMRLAELSSVIVRVLEDGLTYIGNRP